MEKGAPANKLVMGMPLYGQAFTLDKESENGLNAPAKAKGKAGEFTRAAGFLAYYEICEKIKSPGWTVVEDAESRMGPYAYQGRNWVGYDDVAMIKHKSEYIRKMGLAGGMVWALDLDDFKNRCGEGHHPLMNTIKSVLGPKMTADEQAVRSQIIQRTSVIEAPEEDVEEEEEEAVVEVDSNEIEEEEENKDWSYYVPLQPLRQLWYYLVPSS
jgi:chitinase